MSSLGKALQRSKRAARHAQYAGAQERYAEERAAQLEAEDLQQQRRNGGGSGPGLKSIWECNALDNFLTIADERERGYEAERNTKVVFTSCSGKNKVTAPQVRLRSGAAPHPGNEGRRDWEALHAQLTIPKRQEWSYEMSAAQVQQAEREAFINWRRSLAKLEEAEDVLMTPFEKNLEVWRQLWRVVERADVVLEILDARNPLVYRCADFEKYVHDTIHPKTQKNKTLILLLNKADLLTEDQRRAWAAYFQEQGDLFFFFSAKPAATSATMTAEGSSRHRDPTALPDDRDSAEGADKEEELESEEETSTSSEEGLEAAICRNRQEKCRHKNKRLRAPVNVASDPYALAEQRRQWQDKSNQPREKEIKPFTEEEMARDQRVEQARAAAAATTEEEMGATVVLPIEPWTVLDPVQLLDQLALLRDACGVVSDEDPLMAGLVGYPNVGKSSTINAVIGAKKVVVSATPGKTKHFQTLPIPNERRIALCDCPGLVFPSFATTKEEMLCDGILPADHTTDATPAVAVLCRRLPRRLLEELLHISLHPDDDPDQSGTLAERLLNAYSRRRGYFASHDRPNQNRAGKELLKAYVDGLLVYVEPPPNFKPSSDSLSIEALVEAKRQEEAGVAASGSKTAAGRKGGASKKLAGLVVHHTGAAGAEKVAPSDEEFEDVGSWCTEDDEAWEALDDAAAARALSDAGDDRSQDSEMDDAELQDLLPFFLARPPHMHHTFTRQEAFNRHANEERIAKLIEAQEAAARRRARKKPVNKQLFSDVPDTYTFINREGEVELRIDDDDGVIELVQEAPAAGPAKGRGAPAGGANAGAGGWRSRPGAPQPIVLEQKTKPLSKRQQRRQLKKENGGLIGSGKGATKITGF